MRTGTTAFLLGILLLVQFPALPATWLPAILLPFTLFLFVKSGKWRLAGFFLAGFLWALFRGQIILTDNLEKKIEGETLLATGQIVSLPEYGVNRLRFEMDIGTLVDASGNSWPVPGKVRINWYQAAGVSMEPGQVWQLKVRLKRPYSFMNPGGFDYERWLFQHRIRATGYVVDGQANRFTSDTKGQFINRLRYQLREKIKDLIGDSTHAGLIIALGLGDRSLIDSLERDVLIRTGTNHLLAISGLHIGLVAGLVYFLSRRLWSVGQLPLYLPAPRFAAISGIVAACIYAMLAGLSIPTQRSLIMVTVVMLSFFIYRRYAISQTICFALLLVLIVDPFAVMDPGLWLSFAAISIIGYGMGSRTNETGIWWRWGRVQYLVAVGLAPLLLLWFKQVSVVGIPANFIAVPWVSMVVVPLVLAGILLINLFLSAGTFLLECAENTLVLLLHSLKWLSSLDIAVWQQASPSIPALLCGVVAVVILLQPKGMPARWLGIMWFLPLFIPSQPQPAAKEVWLSLLDVGQGLAAVIHTRNHTLVYDTGARFSDTFNAGEAVVVPYLRQTGTRRIDTLIISHGDNDHIGGSSSVLKAFPETPVLTSVPEEVAHNTVSPCIEGQSWQWDGVDFRILHPGEGETDIKDNNQSCVLKVSSGNRQILFSGDIEKEVEQRLVSQYGDELSATVLIAPHHGSKTSSSVRFINAVDPELVLFPAGYRNRFNFPNEDIISRYESRGIRIYDTARNGAILIRLEQSGMSVSGYRQESKRFWHTENQNLSQN